MDEQGRCDWSCLRPHKDIVREIIRSFSSTILPLKSITNNLEMFLTACPELADESRAVARLAGVSAEEVAIANVCYDLASSNGACTAFAIGADDGPYHGHCLDWEVGAEVLRKHGRIFKFKPPFASRDFLSVGWPGFLGVYVGCAPGRFVLTLNAVWSEDERAVAPPLGFILRKAMASIDTYDDVLSILSRCKLACDCLLLVTGTLPEEMVVIERTPHRAALRSPSDGVLMVTNHYTLIPMGSNAPGYTSIGTEPFGVGTHERYGKAFQCLRDHNLRTIEDCYVLLGNAPFTHDLTVQRAAFRAVSGELLASAVSLRDLGIRDSASGA